MREGRFKKLGRSGLSFSASPPPTESAPESAPESAQSGARNSAPNGAPKSALRAALEEKLTAEPQYKSRGLKIRSDILEVIDSLPKGRGKQQIIVNEALEIGLRALGYITPREEQQ